MSVKLSVGPPHITIASGETILVTGPDGQIPSGSQKGLFFRDTRLISRWNIYANGEEWDLLNGGAITSYASRTFLINRAIPSESGEVPARSLSLVLSRSILQGMHEDLDLTNYGPQAACFHLDIVIRADFADIFDVKSGHIVRRGCVKSSWSSDPPRLRFNYRNRDFLRQISITVITDGGASYANGRITLKVRIAPGEGWHACLIYELADGRDRFSAPLNCITAIRNSELGHHFGRLPRNVIKVASSNADFTRVFERAVADMAALRLPISGTSHREFVPAAGAPWFMTLFRAR
jgi:N-terminal domain of (some) glycogen debranching enzymes